MKPREVTMVFLTVTIALFAATFIVAKPALDRWKETRELIAGKRAVLSKATELAESKPRLEAELREIRKTANVHPLPADELPANYLGRMISEMSSRHGVALTRRLAGEEKTHSGVHILPVSCDWDNADTRALHDLLIDFLSSDVMFDVTELRISSKGGYDQLRGSFTVNCVYTK